MNKAIGCFILSCIIVTGVFAQTPVLIRGPYLQLATTTSMNVRWRTDIATISRVRYGLSLGGLNGMVESTVSETEHELKITGLVPNTKYWYTIESGSGLYRVMLIIIL
ncbi:MAG: fibronectin type III domain-containing protein [Agriterribacter sp.]